MVNRNFWQIVFLILLVFLFENMSARASDIKTRNLGVNWKGPVPYLSFSAQDFATDTIHRRLRSGLPQTIITRIYAYPEKGHRPLAISFVSCRIVYDLWQDSYSIQMKTERGTIKKIMRTPSEVQRTCLRFERLPLGHVSDYKEMHQKRIYFAVSVELNPISDKTVEQIKRWLARSDERSQLTGGAFFGSFVSIFVDRRIGTAEFLLSFRSPLYRIP